MSDALASGTCACGNRAFAQLTVVLLDDAPPTFTPADGRARKESNDVRKFYECMACRTRYAYDRASAVWRRL